MPEQQCFYEAGPHRYQHFRKGAGKGHDDTSRQDAAGQRDGRCSVAGHS